MKKIVLSIIALVTVVTTVSVGAFALWKTTVQANTITITTGNIGLAISADGGTYDTSASFTSPFTGVMPNYNTGCSTVLPIYLRNTSTANITLAIKSRLTDLSNAAWWTTYWSNVKSSVSAKFGDAGWTNSSDAPFDSYYTADVNTGVTLAQGEDKVLYMCVKTDVDLDQNLAGSSTQSTWTITGDQTP